MYYESGMFPITVANESTNPTDDNGPIASGGETPPPPEDPPKA